MAMGAVSGVLGAAQLIGGISKTSAERKQVAANNEAQARSLAAQRKQILVQEQATFEQAALAQMDLEQNKQFSEYQTQLGQMNRQTAQQQQITALQAQGQLEQMQAQTQQHGVDIGQLSGLMEMETARIKNDAGLLSAGVQGNNARSQTEQQRYQALSEGQNAQVGNEVDRYGQQVQLAGQDTQNEVNRYGQLSQSADQQLQAAMAAGTANLQEQQTLSQSAQAGQQVFNQVEAEALAQGKKLTAGERRRATMQAMLAASGMAAGGQTDAALVGADKAEEVNDFVAQQMKLAGVSEETALQMVSEGRIAELTKMLGLQEADRVDRKALEGAMMANLTANLSNEQIGLQSEQTNRMADYRNSGITGQLNLANMTADQQQAYINLQQQAAGDDARMTSNQIQGQTNLINMDASAQKEDIIQTMMLNGMGRAAAMQAFEAAMAQDEHTDKINRIMAETGFQIQSGAAASQAQAQLGSLAAQRGSLQYVPQRAPSMLGGILSSAINAGSTVYGGIQQSQQANRASSLQQGNTTYGISTLPSQIQQPSPSSLYGNWALNGNNKAVNGSVGLLSGYGQ